MSQHSDRPLQRRVDGSAPVDKAGKPMLRLPDGRLARPRPGERIPVNRASQLVDLCLVFDTTGSMRDKIDGLVRCMVDFVGALANLKLDWRLTAVPFGDLTVPGDKVVADLPFVTTREAGEQLVQNLPRFGGGTNTGESSLEAVLAALGKPYRKDAVKVLVILTDEPPLESPQCTMTTVGNALRASEVICFVAAPDLYGYRRWADDNGGKWYPIGKSVDTAALLGFLRSLIKDVATTAKAVHKVGAGSVRRYLELERGNGPVPGR